MNGWESTGLVLSCVLCLLGVFEAGQERGWSRGHAQGRAEGEALADAEANARVYPSRSGPAEVRPDPRPTTRRAARLRTAAVVPAWMPEDDWRYPAEDA